MARRGGDLRFTPAAPGKLGAIPREAGRGNSHADGLRRVHNGPQRRPHIARRDGRGRAPRAGGSCRHTAFALACSIRGPGSDHVYGRITAHQTMWHARRRRLLDIASFRANGSRGAAKGAASAPAPPRATWRNPGAMLDGQDAGEQETVGDDAEAEGGENTAGAIGEAAANNVEDAAAEEEGGMPMHTDAAVARSAAQDERVVMREVSSPDGGEAWTLIDVAQSEVRTRQGKRWALKSSAFDAVRAWEARRSEAFSAVQQRYARTHDALTRQATRGKDEGASSLLFLQQRVAADTAYAQALSRQRLGGKPVTEWGAIKRTAARAAPPATAAAVAEVLPLQDSSGNEQVESVMHVLGSMTVQCAEKLSRFAEASSLAKELAAAHAAYTAAADGVLGAWRNDVADELSRLDKACVDAFAAHSATWREMQRQEDGRGAKDLWLSEHQYRAAVASFDARVGGAAGAARELLERFRLAEHRRVTALHGSLRVLVSMQQRLWADVSASTAVVHALFKDRPASTGLDEQPATLALEALLGPALGPNAAAASGALGEYVAPPPPKASTLAVLEGPLAYHRTLLRTWAHCHCVLTTDLFLHAFADAEPDKPRQLLFSMRIDERAPLAAPDDTRVFELSALDEGLLGKVGLRAASSKTTHFRAPSPLEASTWRDQVRRLQELHASASAAGRDAPSPA